MVDRWRYFVGKKGPEGRLLSVGLSGELPDVLLSGSLGCVGVVSSGFFTFEPEPRRRVFLSVALIELLSEVTSIDCSQAS